MRLRYSVITGSWFLDGVLNAMPVYSYELIKKPMPWWESVLYEVPFTMMWAVVTPTILRLAARYPMPTEQWWRPLLVHSLGMLAAATVTKVAGDFSTLPFFPLHGPFQFDRGGPQRVASAGFRIAALHDRAVRLAHLGLPPAVRRRAAALGPARTATFCV